MKTAIVHDYLTQRGGAERVVLAMLRALPDADLHTSLYDPEGTFPEFGARPIRTSPLNRAKVLRRSHRLALPFLALSFARMRVDADVAVCSSSGWAHGADVRGKKVVYCYAPARWLYQTDRYLGPRSPIRPILAALRRPLMRWDKRAASTADRYVVMTHAIADQVRTLYGVEPEVLPPPHNADPSAPREAPKSAPPPGFFLCVARLLRYKNVDAIVDAFAKVEERLVVVGDGPEAARLRARASVNVTFEPRVSDSQLRWLYAECAGTVCASYEDFGLVPLEAAAFGRPTAALRFGGFLDTVVEGTTGVFFDRPCADAIAAAVADVVATDWDAAALRRQAARFSESAFADGLRAIVDAQL